jgi:amidohydrolase
MDALQMEDRCGLDFASSIPGKMHACGHDIHTVMAMGAAILLNERKDELEGSVKIMFQPGEEIFQGAKLMIKAGILENPSVDAALDMHVDASSTLGNLSYPAGPFTTSGDNFTIKLRGKGAHGSEPNNARDPISAATKIYSALMTLRANEVSPKDYFVLSICSLNAGNSHNIIPDEAVLKGTMRTYNAEVRDYMLQRIPEIVTEISQLYKVESVFELEMSTPSIVNDAAMVKRVETYLDDFGVDFVSDPYARISASDDFAYISTQIPSVMLFIGAKPEGVEHNYLHNSAVVFDEDVIPLGAAIFAHCAYNYLSEGE